MQCPNCKFFNLPGSEICGRCASPLGLATAAIAVMPPRATPMQKRLRRMLPVRRIYSQMSETAVASGLVRHAPDGSQLLFYLWCAIPGWPHFARRQMVRGHLFLWGFLLFLFTGLLLMGSWIGSVLIGLAFSVHSSAIADLINQRFNPATVRERMMIGLAVSAVLFAAVYWPMAILIGQFASPYQVQVPLRPFQPGDVVLTRVIQQPRAGDVVLYELPQSTWIRWHGARDTQRMIEGRNIDRVLAGPGATVECRGGVLFINGSPAKWLPLNPVNYPRSWKQIVPQGSCFILPSDEGEILSNIESWQISLVPEDSVVGRVFVRTQPFSRFSIIR